MKNKYQYRSRISERLFRDILRLFCSDICALTAAELAGVNKNTTHQLYGRFRARVVQLTLDQSKHFTGRLRSMKAISERGEYAANVDVALVARFRS